MGLRKLFLKPRTIARKVLKEQLSQFRDKMASGMGNIFGPNEAELRSCVTNANKRVEVIERFLGQYLDTVT